MIIWLIGLSGSGKTTIGKELYAIHKEEYKNTIFLDGDILREVWGDHLSHDINGRKINAHRISNLCLLLDKQNIHVIACVLSIFPEWQRWNRENFKNYFQIYLKCPISFLKKQDDKGLYKKAEMGNLKNVVGVDIPFPEPISSDLVLNNSARNKSPNEIAQNIFLKTKKIIEA